LPPHLLSKSSADTQSRGNPGNPAVSVLISMDDSPA